MIRDFLYTLSRHIQDAASRTNRQSEAGRQQARKKARLLALHIAAATDKASGEGLR